MMYCTVTASACFVVHSQVYMMYCAVTASACFVVHSQVYMMYCTVTARATLCGALLFSYTM